MSIIISKYEVVKLFIKEYEEEIVKGIHQYKQSKNFDINNIDHKKGVELAINGTFEFYNYLMNHPKEMRKTTNLTIHKISSMRHSVVKMTFGIYDSFELFIKYYNKERDLANWVIINRCNLVDDILERIKYIGETMPYYYNRHSTYRRRYVTRELLEKIEKMKPETEKALDYLVSEKLLSEELKNKMLNIPNYYEAILYKGK